MNVNSDQIARFQSLFQQEMPTFNSRIHHAAAAAFFKCKDSLGELRKNFATHFVHLIQDGMALDAVIVAAEKIFQSQNLKRKRETDAHISRKRLRQDIDCLFAENTGLSAEQQEIMKFIDLSTKCLSSKSFESSIWHEEQLDSSFKKMMALLEDADTFLAIEAATCLNFLAKQRALSQTFAKKTLPLIVNLFNSQHIDGARVAYLCMSSFMKIGLHNEILDLNVLDKIYQELVSYTDEHAFVELNDKACEEALCLLKEIHAHLMQVGGCEFLHASYLMRLLQCSCIGVAEKAALSMLGQLMERFPYVLPLLIENCTEKLSQLLSHSDCELVAHTLDLVNQFLYADKDIASQRFDISFSKDEVPHAQVRERKAFFAELQPGDKFFNRALFEKHQEKLLHGLLKLLETSHLRIDWPTEDLQCLQQQAIFCLIALCERDRNVCQYFNQLQGYTILDALAKKNSAENVLEAIGQCLATVAIYTPNSTFSDVNVANAYVAILSDLLPCNALKDKASIVAALCRLVDSNDEGGLDFSEQTIDWMFEAAGSTQIELSLNAMAFLLEVGIFGVEHGVPYIDIFSEKKAKKTLFQLLIGKMTTGDMAISQQAFSHLLSYFHFYCCEEEAQYAIKIMAEAAKSEKINSQGLFHCINLACKIFGLHGDLSIDLPSTPLTIERYSTNKSLNLFPNFEIHCDGQKIACDRNILATHSPYFFQLFSNWASTPSSLLVLEKMDGSTLQKVVKWMYGETVNFATLDQVLKLFKMADHLLIEKIKQDCVKLLCEHISIDTAATFLDCAISLHSEELQLNVMVWMMKNYPALTTELQEVMHENWEAFRTAFGQEAAQAFSAITP